MLCGVGVVCCAVCVCAMFVCACVPDDERAVRAYQRLCVQCDEHANMYMLCFSRL